MNVKSVTLQDIGDRLGISKYSVSRALGAKGGVSEETRRAVFRLARELGYQHPALGERERGEPAGHLVLLLPRDDAHNSEYWMRIAEGAEAAAERAGFGLISRSVSSAANTGDGSSWFDGVIVAGQRSRGAMSEPSDWPVPAVLLSYPLPGDEFDAITVADWQGGYAVGRHLLDLGHRRIAFVTDQPAEASRRERLRGLRSAAVGAEHVEIDEVHLPSEAPLEAFEARYFGSSTRPSLPTAFFCCTDAVALPLMSALLRSGVTVPDDVSVVGFNDYAETSRYVPKLTTVRAPAQELGEVAVERLLARLRGDARARAPLHVLVSPELVVRESTAPRAQGSPPPES